MKDNRLEDFACTLSYTGAGNIYESLSFTGATSFNFSSGLSLFTGAGVHVLKLICTDFVGNSSSTSISFPPVINFNPRTLISSGAINNATFTIINSGGNITGISITGWLDGGILPGLNFDCSSGILNSS